MDPEALPLRDIHLPEPISAWPPAPGWWLLALLMVAGLLWSIAAWARWRRQRPIRQAMRTVKEAEALLRRGESLAAVQSLSAVLRRCAITLDPSGAVAGLTGKAWLSWLDGRWTRQGFSGPIGQFLLTAPYQPSGQLGADDAQALLALGKSWIRHQKVAKSP